MPVPVGDVMVIVPVLTEQVGCVALVIGAEGVAGCALIVVLVPGEMQPAEFLAVTIYVPGATDVNTPVVFV